MTVSSIGFLMALLLALPFGKAEGQVILTPTRYEMELDVDYAAEELYGAVRLTVHNPSTEPVSRASLLLYRLMQVRSVRDEQGRDLLFDQAVVSIDDFAQLQVNQSLITLPEPL